MARISVLIPILLFAAALVCSLLVLLAGKDTGFLTNIFLLRLDTSNIRPSGLNIDLDSVVSSLPVPEDTARIPPGIVDEIPDELIDKVAQTVAKKLGLRDFYTSQIMNYCSGVAILTEDDGNANTPRGTQLQTTYCSPIDGLYAFDPVAIFQTQLIAEYTINDIGIPAEVKKGAEALALAYNVMFLAYTIGIGVSGLCLVLSLTVGWMESRVVAWVLGILSLMGAVSLAVGAGIATAIAITLRDVFNQHMGEKVNVWAKHDGGLFMGLSWAAATTMVVAWVYWMIGCCGRGSEERARRREEKKNLDEDGMVEDEMVEDGMVDHGMVELGRGMQN